MVPKIIYGSWLALLEYTANKNRQTSSHSKSWCNYSGVRNLHHGYYTTTMESRSLFRHNPVSRGTNKPIRKSEFAQLQRNNTHISHQSDSRANHVFRLQTQLHKLFTHNKDHLHHSLSCSLIPLHSNIRQKSDTTLSYLSTRGFYRVITHRNRGRKSNCFSIKLLVVRNFI